MNHRRRWVGIASLIVLLLAVGALAACGGTPDVETVIEQVEVEVTRLVEGETVTVIETRMVEVAREILITPTPEPGRSTFIVALARPRRRSTRPTIATARPKRSCGTCLTAW